MGTSGEEVEVRQTPDLDKLRRDLQVIRICALMYMRPAGLCVVHVCFDWWAPSFLQHFTVSGHVHPHHAVFAMSVMLAGYKGAPFTLSSCVSSVCVVGMVGLAKQRSGLAHSSPKLSCMFHSKVVALTKIQATAYSMSCCLFSHNF